MSEAALVSTRCPVMGSSVLFKLYHLAPCTSEDVLLDGEVALGHLIAVDAWGNWLIEIPQGRVKCHRSNIWTFSEYRPLLYRWEGKLPDYIAVVEARGFVGLDDIALPTRAPAPRLGIGYRSHDMDTIIACPGCARKLLAPSERAGMVRCPKCAATWQLIANGPGKSFRGNDTYPDRPLHGLSDTLPDGARADLWAIENALHAKSRIGRCDLEQLANELCAELRRRGVPYTPGDVLSYVRTAHEYGFLWTTPAGGSVRDAVGNLAERLQAANAEHDWEYQG